LSRPLDAHGIHAYNIARSTCPTNPFGKNSPTNYAPQIPAARTLTTSANASLRRTRATSLPSSSAKWPPRSGKAERKINAALAELERLGQTIDTLEAQGAHKHQAEIRAKIVAFNEARKRTEQAVWELRVQREGLGFLRNNDFAVLYPIPPKRTMP
jgi:hypothetical protein